MAATDSAKYLREIQKAKTTIEALQLRWKEQEQNNLDTVVTDLQAKERMVDNELKALDGKQTGMKSALEAKKSDIGQLLSTHSSSEEEASKAFIDALILSEATRVLLLQNVSMNNSELPVGALTVEKIIPILTSLQAGNGTIEMKVEELMFLKETSFKHLEQVFEWLAREEGNPPTPSHVQENM